MTLLVLATGALALVQDLGRPGHAGSGVGRSGAADRGALRLGNRLLGSAEGAAGIEVLLGGLSVRAEVAVSLAVTGAPAPASIDGRAVGHQAHLRLAPGQVLVLGVPRRGLRSYLCVRGGLATTPVLGSQSCDTLSGLGPPPLQVGDRLALGLPRGPLPEVEHVPGPSLPAAGPLGLRLLAGPRRDWLHGGLTGPVWTVGADSDRVGLRLVGQAVRRRGGELPSEGLLPGAVQVPPDGQPVLFLADAPVTGGYPVVGVLSEPDLDRAAQLRPGDTLTFRQP